MESKTCSKKYSSEQEGSEEENTKGKLNKEDMSSEEMAEILKISDRTVKNTLRKLCEDNEGIDMDDFKEGKNYRFKASWNGILIVLLQVSDLPRYDKRKSQYTLEGYVQHMEIMLKNVEEYLTPLDQALVKSHSSYQQAILEKDLYEVLMHRIGSISTQVGLMPASLRFQALAGIMESIENVPSYLAQKNARYTIKKAQYKNHVQKDKKNLIDEPLFKEDIEEYLISLLKLRLHGEEGIQESYKVEVAGATMLEQLILGELTDAEDEGVKKIVGESREYLLHQPEVKDVLERVASVLNLEKPLDRLLQGWIEETVLLIGVRMNHKKADIELGGELVRRAVTNQVQADLKKFNTKK